ncbi:hypothetical protein CPC08DRAFT_708732 [Agrocybe pediades]|nr:hypothetical protein CPC08DRAFT_708732 [Agrocybe pediades]
MLHSFGSRPEDYFLFFLTVYDAFFSVKATAFLVVSFSRDLLRDLVLYPRQSGALSEKKT